MRVTSGIDSQKVLDRLYGENKRRERRLRVRRFALRLQRHLWKVGFLSALVAIWVVLHVYYYNKLVAMDTRVQVSWAQVETQLQRRHNIQLNMTSLVLDYAKHERTLHERLTRIRTAAEAATAPLDKLPPKQLDTLFPQIRMVAEQYPQLRLSENFQQFSRAVIDNENKIASQYMAYNEAVNRMATVLRQVPGNIFGAVCGFKLSRYRYYEPDRRTLPFRTIEQVGN